MANQSDLMDKLTSLAKRRGFIFQSSEIYGGLGSTWDYGPLGVELKRNVKSRWWRDVVTAREDVVGMDAAILMHPRVWEASGHVEQFHDPLVDDRNTKKRYRLDHLLEAQDREVIEHLSKDLVDRPVEGNVDVHTITGIVEAIMDQADRVNLNDYGILADGKEADWTIPRQFNLMFKTFIGSSEESGVEAYLRPETPQGIFVNFLNAQATARAKLPFGIAQLGKAFRNEITTGNFLFRTREFEQMEMEFFVRPAETAEWLEYWSQARLEWYVALGIRRQKLRVRPHSQEELSHYSKATNDVEYEFPFGWGELEGIADRGTYDLDQHADYSGKKLTWFDPDTNEHIVPAVVEASAGVDRTVLTILTDAYHEEEAPKAGGEGVEQRVVLRLSPDLAPITVAVFPLVNRDGMPELARKIVDDLRGDFAASFDAGGSIGRRYRRQDEAGTPFGITVDGQTLEDQTVTIRDRDSMEQERVSIEKVKEYLRGKTG
ncbi:MAG: glycine--tRNA ligase [Fidelibacterota bacterium]|nr:MAG: glycine--tRNA ligase [Candidatus Neomarinimicrobiota bacterium]